MNVMQGVVNFKIILRYRFCP